MADAPEGTGVFTVVATLRAAKGKADALVAMLTEQVEVVRKAEPGCTAYRLHRSTSDPDLLLFYETYVDEAAFDVHRKAPYLADYRARREREGLLDGPVEVQVFRSVTG
jgi:quinol monooxygenase YgiN